MNKLLMTVPMLPLNEFCFHVCNKSFLNEPNIGVGDLSVVHFPICLKQSKEEARDDP